MSDYQIFISYRRAGASELAQLLYTRLTSDGYRVFYDIESLRSGKFNKQLYDRIDECSDILVLLPKDGLKPRDTEEDWVIMEIAHALSKGKNVIPVMMRGFEWPEQLPDEIAELKYCQGIAANMDYFDAAYEKMKGLLECCPAAQVKAEEEKNKQLRLAEVLLLNNRFEDAMEQYDRMLVANVECAEAYLGKLMAEFHLHNKEELAQYYSSHLLYEHINYKLAREYAEGEMKEYIDSLVLPQCKNHKVVATARCTNCKELLCDECANQFAPADKDCEIQTWISGKTLCPECLKQIHEQTVNIQKKNRGKIIFDFIKMLLSLVFPLIFGIWNQSYGAFAVVLGIEMALGHVFKHEMDSERNGEDFIGIIGLLLYAFLFTMAAPIIIFVKVIRRSYWWLRMNKLAADTKSHMEKGTVTDEGYIGAYYEMIRIAQALMVEVSGIVETQEAEEKSGI